MSIWFFSLFTVLLIYQQFENPWKKEKSFDEFLEDKEFYLHDVAVDLGASRDLVNEGVEVEEDKYNNRKPVEPGDHVKCKVESRGFLGSDQRFILREKNGEEILFNSIEEVKDYWENRETTNKNIPEPEDGKNIEEHLNGLDHEESMEALNRSIKNDIDKIKNEVKSAKDDIKREFEGFRDRI